MTGMEERDRVLLERLDERTGHILAGQHEIKEWLLKHEEHDRQEFAAVRNDLDETDDEVQRLHRRHSRLVGASVAAGVSLNVAWALLLAYIRGVFSGSGGA